MGWWTSAVGAALLLLATFDLLVTSISSSTPSGPLTDGLTRGTWWVVTRLSPSDTSRLLRVAGPVTTALTIMMWLSALWAGWALVFSADPQAVVDAATGRPVELSGRFLFAAYTAFSLGYGNMVPTGPWEIVAAVALLNGLSAATLAVTYAIPVVTAVTDRRRQGAVISAAGVTAEEIVATLHGVNGFGALDQLLVQVTPQVLLTAERHLAYPVIHHYHAGTRSSAFPPSVAALDDALTLLEVAVDPRDGPNGGLVTVWRRAVDQLLELVADTGRDRSEVPPSPSLEVLDRLGIDHVDRATYLSRLGEHDERRRRLHQYVRSARWAWPTDG